MEHVPIESGNLVLPNNSFFSSRPGNNTVGPARNTSNFSSDGIKEFDDTESADVENYVSTVTEEYLSNSPNLTPKSGLTSVN